MKCMNAEELETAALQLDIKSRARLAERLLHSLEDLSEAEVHQLWLEEARRRDVAMDADPDRGASLDDVLREAHDLTHPPSGST